MANDRDFGVFKIIALIYFIFLHKHVKQSLLKSDRSYHYNIKIIFCGYSKSLSVEIMKNGWRPVECQVYDNVARDHTLRTSQKLECSAIAQIGDL